MKAYRLKMEGSNDDVGYRVVTDKGNSYDILDENMPYPLSVVGVLYGKAYGTEFRVGDTDRIPEGYKGSIIPDIASLCLGNIGVDDFGYDFMSGKDLERLVLKYDKFNRRSYVKRCVSELLNDELIRYNIIELYGVRRTGKTVSMYHMICDLLKNGVDSSDICYISLSDVKNDKKVDDLYLSGLLNFLSRREGIKYIFVDEITYMDGTLNFLTSFGNGFRSSRLIISGTNSSVFIMPNYTDLYDRALIIKTTIIQFNEYARLYNGSTILDYIRSGGILVGLEDYKIIFDDAYSEKLSKVGSDYVYSSIFDNLINSFERYDDMCRVYPTMYSLYGNYYVPVLMTFIIKFVQRFSDTLVLTTLLKIFSSSDVGISLLNYKNANLNSSSFVSENLSRVKKVLNSYIRDGLSIKDISDKDLSESARNVLVSEIREYLSEIDCYYKIVDGDDNSEYILPLLVRYGLACRTTTIIKENWKNICRDLGIDEASMIPMNELSSYIMSNVEGVLCEEVLRLNLDMYKKGSTRKYRERNMEIDIIYENDIIEVKKLNKALPYQARWLVNTKIGELFKGKRRVLLTNDTDERVMLISEYDALKDLIQHRTAQGSVNNKGLLEELKVASKEKFEVHCLNMSNYLLEVTSKER